MARFAMRLLGFTVIAVIIYVVLTVFAARLLPWWTTPNIQYRPGWHGFSLTRFNELQQTDSVDVLILGSSHAYSNFDVRIFRDELKLKPRGDNLKVFNLGSSSQTPIQTQLLLSKYLEQLNPQLVLYEVYPRTLAIDGLESTLDIISNHPSGQLTGKLVVEQQSVTAMNTWIYASFRDVVGLNQGMREPLTRNGATYIPGGYVERKMQTYTDTIFGKFDWVLRENQVAAFKSNIKTIQSHNSQLFLIYAPVTEALYESVRNHDHTDSLYRSQATYIDMNSLQAIDDSLHFYDHHHLNQEGVRLFNHALIDTLQLKYLPQ